MGQNALGTAFSGAVQQPARSAARTCGCQLSNPSRTAVSSNVMRSPNAPASAAAVATSHTKFAPVMPDAVCASASLRSRMRTV